MELALKAAADHARQQAESRDSLVRMEAIESFPSVIDSQPVITRVHSSSDDMTSHVEEIEDFSDDQRTQQSQRGIQKDERRTRRYSGLHLMSYGQPKEAFRSTENDLSVQQEAQQEWQLPSKQPAYQSQDYEAEVEVQDQGEYSICDISPTLSQYTTDTDKCPICRRMIPVNDLIAHVDAELLANEQREREDMQKKDQALAQSLDESYQTQDVVIIRDSLSQHGSLTQAPPHLTLQQQGQPSSTDIQSLSSSKTPVRANTGRDDPVSLDTPTRKVSHLTLDSPSSRTREQGGLRGAGLSSGSAILSSGSNLSHPLESETIDLSDIESLSSQSAFQIQPGQTIQDIALDASDVYISTRPTGRKKDVQKTSSRTAIKKAESGHLPTPFLIQDEMLDDDMDDFLDKPEPASMLNRSFRTSSGKASGSAATVSRGGSARRKVASKKSSKAIVELYDSEDDNNRGINENPVIETKRGKAIRKGVKLKSAVLDGILPESARQRRQELLKKSRGEHRSGIVDDDNEIEVGRRHPAAEKLWNQEDDLLESEHLDRRQVKGVGLGGIVGGIGALPGSLAMSKITKDTAVSSASAGETVDATVTTDPAAPKGTIRANRDASSDLAEDNGMSGGSASLEFEDPNYGMQSQEWWDAVQAKNPERPGALVESVLDAGDDTERAGGETEGDDNGYMSPLDDFVDLRERRDDPALAMYFAQFGMANGDVNGSGSTASAASKGRGRGRGRTRGAASSSAKKGVSYARGVGPMSTTTSAGGSSNASGSTCEQTVLTAYGIPRRTRTAADNRYGARNVSFGGRATTANGSMAIRSKPTQPFVPGGASRGRGSRGGSSKSYWRGRNAWAARGQGRGRGRGRGGG
ncbi:hypothetical protein EDD21DRAFT_381704 [Dissophora ornata]|nr:hypothetical protein EDD21DRAFT_381704 [Dissophora ornata]